MRKTGYNIQCYICTKWFYKSACHLKRIRQAHLCSRVCVAKFNSIRPHKQQIISVQKSCFGCTKDFNVRLSWEKRKKFCTVQCKNSWLNKNISRKYKIGSECHLWKGGITILNKVIRTSHVYKIWRKLIYERDNYKCQKCGQRGIRLNVDHYPMPFSKILKEFSIKTLISAYQCKTLWLYSNARTLCENCHRQTDTYGFKLNLIKQ